jgi:hypothetical protein
MQVGHGSAYDQDTMAATLVLDCDEIRYCPMLLSAAAYRSLNIYPSRHERVQKSQNNNDNSDTRIPPPQPPPELRI